MSKILLNNSTGIDLEKLIDSRLLIQANSGGGKSWLMRRILEQSHGKVQQIILDPEGEFSTLREKYEYILCGKGADVPAESRSAALLAHRLLEFKTSAIVDLYELHPQERKQFVRLFLEAMVNAPKELWHPVMVVIDEAHTFVPEKGESEAANAVIGLASLGRKRGFCAVLATQRISKLHKDAAAECNNKLIGRTGLDIDRKRASEELGFTTKDQSLELRTLDPGEFFAFGPAISNEVVRVSVGEVATTHPKAGSKRMVKLAPPTEGVKKILAKLSDLPQEAAKEAKTVAELKEEIRQLKRVKLPIPAAKATHIDPQAVEKAVKEAISNQDKIWQRLFLDFASSTQEMISKMKAVPFPAQLWQMPTKKVLDLSKKIDKRDFRFMDIPIIDHKLKKDYGEFKVRDSLHPESLKFPPLVISSSQQKILNSLSWLDSIGVHEGDKNQVAFLSDQSPRSSGYTNNVSTLRVNGLITYPTPGRLKLTLAGSGYTSVISNGPTSSEELREQIRQKLSSSQWAILKALIDCYPDPISKTEAAGLANQSVMSSGYTNNVSFLRTMGLIDYPNPGMLVALPILFIEQ